MKVGELVNFLESLYISTKENKVSLPSVLLLGAPGVGKSRSCRDLAKRIASITKKEFIDYNDIVADKIISDSSKYYVFCDFRLTEVEPSDLIGIPEKVNGSVRFAPLQWAFCLNRASGMLLLDEITNVQREDVISAVYKLVLDRKAGFVPLNSDVLVIACGNKPEHSSIARLLPNALLNRLLILDIDPPSIDEWKDWMDEKYGEKWDKRCYVFLKEVQAEEKRNYLLAIPKTQEGLEEFPTPRSWTRLSRLMWAGVQSNEVITGSIGHEAGIRFISFMKVNIDIEELISNPETFDSLSLDAKYMASFMLAAWCSRNSEQVNKVLKLVDRMAKFSKEFITLTCTNLTRDKLVIFIKELIKHNVNYERVLLEIAEVKSILTKH